VYILQFFGAVLLVASNSIEDRSALNVEDTNNNEIGIEKRPALDIIIEANEKEGVMKNLTDADTVQTTEQASYRHESQHSRKKRAVVNSPSLKWPNGRVPYVLDSSLAGAARTAISDSIADFSEYTCIKWVEKESSDVNYVRFFKGLGCYSNVGRVGGRQDVSIGDNCQFKQVVLHEMLHALGFYHEHSRRDRDSYVTVNYDNIRPGSKDNFNIQDDSVSLDSPYDKKGIMHYSNFAFAIDRSIKTLESKSDPDERLGSALEMTEIDKKQLNKFYECPDVETQPPVTLATTTKAPETEAPATTTTKTPTTDSPTNTPATEPPITQTPETEAPTTKEPTTEATTTPKPEECQDNHHFCGHWWFQIWGKHFVCHNRSWQSWCAKTCNAPVCDRCARLHDWRPWWVCRWQVYLGRCEQGNHRFWYMHSKCGKSCCRHGYYYQ